MQLNFCFALEFELVPTLVSSEYSEVVVQATTKIAGFIELY
jgi:hypothetical protein